MLITRVELENIKSYRHANVSFRRGTTAIRGQNGTGKTTLVEAIGFALFDYLPYSQAQFVREGERSGTVIVTFQSGLDDCEYQVVRRCGAQSAWYVVNPLLNKREVEQRADVIAWLREHLPFQGEIELGAFFSDALGVQQGTFTSDFLAAPAVRKRKFDALLQVEEYRRAYDKLVDTRHYLQEQITEVSLRIKGLEAETAALSALRAELTQQHADYIAGNERFQAREEAREQAEKRYEALQRLRDALAALDAARQQAEYTWQLTRQALDQAQGMLDEAKKAHRVLDENADAHALHLHIEAEMRTAHAQQQAQQDLLKQQTTYREQHASARATLQHASAQVAQAEAARREMVALAPQVEEQAGLEQQLSAAQQQAKRLGEIGQGIEQLEADCARLSAELADQAQRIAEIEAQRPQAALLDERRAEVQRLSLEVQRRADREGELRQSRQSLQEMAERRKKNAARVAKEQENVDKLHEARPLVETLPALETQWNDARQEVAQLQGNIKRHNESRLQSAGGQCPFLHERCLNIQQKGLASLEAYFDRLIERDQVALVPLEIKQAALEQQVQDVRVKKSYVDRLDEFEQRLREAQEQQEVARQEAERLTNRERELVALLDATSASAERLSEAQQLLKQSDEADKRVRALEGLLTRQADQQRQLDSQAQRLEALQAERLKLADAPTRAEQISQQLRDLDDPRRRYAQQEIIARQDETARRLLSSAREQVMQAEAALAALEAQLAPYAGLDDGIARLNQQAEQSRAGYQTYLAHEQLAARVPERQAACDAALTSERHAQEGFTLADQHYAEQAAGFDPEALASANKEKADLSDEISQLRADLRTLKTAIDQREQQIAAGQAKQVELEAARAEQAELEETLAMLLQFRETIKDAGPYVMKELLRHISKEANRIFGEILGDHSAELSWEENYEIVLRARGQARSFAQFSGGEQMSAALAVRLALLRTLAHKLDIAFFDEPTQNMDELRRSNLAEQIRRVRGFDQLIVISHDDTFEQGLDSVISLHKLDGETIVGSGDLVLVGSGAEMDIDSLSD